MFIIPFSVLGLTSKGHYWLTRMISDHLDMVVCKSQQGAVARCVDTMALPSIKTQHIQPFTWIISDLPPTNQNLPPPTKNPNRTDNPKEVSNKHLHFKDEKTESQHGSPTMWRWEKESFSSSLFLLRLMVFTTKCTQIWEGRQSRIKGYKIKLSSKGFSVGT